MRAGIPLTFSRAAASLLVVLLSACAAVRPPAGVRADREERLTRLTHWRLEGRIAVQSPQEAFQAGLDWEHEGRQDRVQISGPLSQGAYSIVLQDDLILVRDSSGNARSSRNPSSLLREELGVAVPLSSLRYWVLGSAEPSGVPPERDYDEDGQLRQLRQSGWRLDYLEFMPVGDFVLPQKLQAQGQDIKLKLIIDDWSIRN